MITGPKEIVILQGDYYRKTVHFNNIEPELISNVNITCKSCGLSKDLSYDSENKRYIFELSSDETTIMEPAISTYDLTVTFTGDKIKTVCYNAGFKVLKKTNKL